MNVLASALPTPTVPPAARNPASGTPDLAAVIAFLDALAVALHRFGAPSHRIEPLLSQVADRLAVRGEFFVEPTAIHLALHTDAGTLSRFSRVEPGQDDLERLAELDALTLALIDGEMSLAAANVRLEAILARPPRYGAAVEAAGFALASSSAAVFFGGGPAECTAAGLGAVGIALLGRWSARHPRVTPIFEGLAAFALAAMITITAAFVPLAPDLAVLAGLIILIPGLRLTVAVSEMATGHLSAGVARLASTAVSFGALGFGALLATRLVNGVFAERLATVATPVVLPPVSTWIALAVAPIGFAVLLRAARRDLLVILLTAPLGFLAARLSGAALGTDLAPLVGAFTMTAVSNALARWRERPASVTLVPGFLLLVPGSIGFRSLATLLSNDVVLGVATAVEMLTVAAGLVGGMLLANVLVPARRAL